MAPRLAVIVVLALALYARTATFGFSYLDDDVLIIDDQAFLSQPSAGWRTFARPYFQAPAREHTYYRPLVNVSYALDAAWSGANAHGYHLTNVVLHAAVACLLFLLLRRLGFSANVSVFGALVFTAHPALTQAVAWIPGRNDVLLAVFSLASWLLLPYRSRSADATAPPFGAGVGRDLAHLFLFLCALFTKETAVVLPLVFLGHLLWLERGRWRDLARPALLVGGWAAALAVYLAARIAVSAKGAGLAGLSASGAIRNLPLLVGSLGKLVIPVNLSVLAIPGDTSPWPGALAMVALLLIVLSWSRLWSRFSPPSPPATELPHQSRRVLLFGLACTFAFVAPSLPASNLLILENRLYLPAIGIAIAACAFASFRAGAPGLRIGVAAAIVATLALVSFVRSGHFRDRLTFAQAAVRGSPHSSLAHRNLGVTYHVAGDTERARHEYQAALAQDAAEPVAHNNLAVVLMAAGQLPDAEWELRQELLINPRYAQAHRNLALVLDALGRDDEAAHEWESSLALNDRDIDAVRALVAYYGPRDAAKAAKFRAILDAR